MLKHLLPLTALLISVPAQADAPAPLQQRVEAALAAAPIGTRFGLLVVDEQGREVVAIAPDQRFIPASNTKLFTTAAAMALLSGDDTAFRLGGATELALVAGGKGAPDAVLTGRGGVSLSTAPDCVQRCLAQLADWVASRTRRVRDLVADDSHFVDQRWSPGMSWNNIGSDSGTAISALIIDNNEVPIAVAPGLSGQPARVTVSPYFTLVNEVVTAAEGKTRIEVDRAVNGRTLRVYGQIAAGATPWKTLLGIDDGADYAAWTLRQALAARGVKITGKTRVIHRPVRDPQAPEQPGLREQRQPAALLVVEAPGLAEEVVAINKPSQNLHAEALLRRVGITASTRQMLDPPAVQQGSREAGLAALRSVLAAAGIPRAGYDFADGSGMSTYNRVSPRAAVALLRWGAGQPWGADWRASLPVGGVDGTLKRRFTAAPLAGKVFAKTGTLNATNALAGYMRAASGRELTFAILANDVPDGTSALAAIDSALGLVAAAN